MSSGIRTRTATIETSREGIVMVRILSGAVQRLDDAKANIRASAEARPNGRKGPLLVDIRGSAPLDAETRHCYSGHQIVELFTAIALVVPIGIFGKMFGNVYLRIARLGIPTKLFDAEPEALRWLGKHLP